MLMTTVYEIRVRDHLTAGWSQWFEEMDLRYEADGEMVLNGYLPDQAALHGVLARIRDLGLTLISVKQLEESNNEPTINPE